MQVTLEKGADLSGIIKVEVVEADYADKVKKELKEIGRTRQIPGFRPGHVSLDQLSRRFGKEVKSHVLNEEVYRAVIEYIQNNKVQILGEPLPVEVKEVNLNDKDYTFEYEVGFAPEINVEINKDITVPYYNIEVSQEMVNQQDEALRRRFGAQVPAEETDDRSLIKGALMELNADGTVKTEEGAIQVIDGIVAPFYFTDKDEAAKFANKKIGDKVVFNPAKSCNGNAAELASMLHLEKEQAQNVTADFELAISEIIVVKPAELGEEYYKEVFPGSEGVKNEEEYFAALRQMIDAQLAPNSEAMFSHDAQKVLMDKFSGFELPDGFLKKWLVARNEGTTAEMVEAEYGSIVPGIKWELLSGKIAEQLDLKVTDEDLLGFAKAVAYQQFAQYGMTNLADEIITNYAKQILEDKKNANRMREDVANRKLFNAVRALVNLDEKTVSIDEFRKIANPEEAAAE